MPNKDFIVQLAAKLKEYLEQIEEFKDVDEKKFENDPHIYWMVDHGLHLAIQCAIDSAKEIILILKLPKPRVYAEVFFILCRRKVISYQVSKVMQELAIFRNHLIHEYLYMDPKEIYTVYTYKRKFLYRFFKEVSKFVKEQKEK